MFISTDFTTKTRYELSFNGPFPIRDSNRFDSLCESIRIDSFCKKNRPFDSLVVMQFFLVYHGLRGSASPVLTATGFVNGRWQFSTPHRINTP